MSTTEPPIDPQSPVAPQPTDRVPGLFVVGTDTGVGKTQVASRIAAALVRAEKRVGVYKPAASGCSLASGELISDDAVALAQAAGRIAELPAVCPQRFAAPLAPHLAAIEAGKRLDPALLRTGIDYWRASSDVIVVEGAGGLMSPLGEKEYVADLAAEFGLPLVLVAANRIGVINQVLTTLLAVRSYGKRLRVAGVVLSDVLPSSADDPSVATNRRELEERCDVPVLAGLGHGADAFDREVDWFALAGAARTGERGT